MGHFLDWGNYSSPSALQQEALKNAAYKNGLTYVEIISDPKLFAHISDNFNALYLWSIDNLEGGWTVINKKKEKEVAFYFSSEEDQLGFKLTWT